MFGIARLNNLAIGAAAPAGYTVPTAEFTDDSSTKLLLHLNSSAVDTVGSGRTAKTMTSGGGLTYNTSNKKFGTASANHPSSTTTASFVNTVTTHTDFTFMDKDFTIEAWVYFTSVTADFEYGYGSGVPKFIGKHDGGGNWAWSFGISSSGYPKIYYYQGGYQEAVGSTTASTSTWNHIMFDFRNSDKRLRIGLNGAFVHESLRTGIADPGGNQLRIGTIRLNNPAFLIDEVRVSHILRY